MDMFCISLTLYNLKMKKLISLFLILTLCISCKKDRVDASNTQAFQSSINDMASSLPTLQQIKFNEALYILKKFAVSGEDDVTELKQLAKFLDGKSVPEILSLADSTAKKNGMEWTSNGPPSLGEMNIFGNVSASEVDKNNIEASGLNIEIKNVGSDSLGIKALQVVPHLVDQSDKEVEFADAGLETVMEVFSGGIKISTAKNIVSDNHFKGFYLKFASLPYDKIFDNKIDIKVSLKTTKKTFQFTKTGISINPNSLTKPKTIVQDSTSVTTNPVLPEVQQPVNDPKSTVSKFLNNLNSQNLKAAFDSSQNPNWGSFETFSNPNSGFGTVKSLSVKNISTTNNSASSPTISASYEVTDKAGKTTVLNVAFGLKNVNGEWKIISYQIQ
jgi:hypothetical protein